MLRSAYRLHLWLPAGPISVRRRSLFTKDFLGVSTFLLKQEAVLSRVKDCTLSQVPHEPILSEDVKRSIYCSASREDVDLACQSLRSYVVRNDSGNSILQLKKALLFKEFVTLCHSMLYVSPLQRLWNDAEFISSVGFIDQGQGTLGPIMSSVVTSYLSLLFHKRMYQQVVQEVNRLLQVCRQPSLYVMTVGMMSCLKLNTADSLHEASGWMQSRMGPKMMRFIWTVQPYAMLAILQGQLQLAYEAVSMADTDGSLRESLMIDLLCRMNRVDQAISLLSDLVQQREEEDLPNVNKKLFSLECMHRLTKCVDQDRDKKHQLASLFQKLDRVACIDQRNMVTILTQPIDSPASLKAQRDCLHVSLKRQGYAISFEDDLDLHLHEDEIHRQSVQ